VRSLITALLTRDDLVEIKSAADLSKWVQDVTYR